MSSFLLPCPSFGDHHIQRNDEPRILIIDGEVVKFTPTEYRLLILLLERRTAQDNDLIQQALLCDATPQMRKNLDKHIDNIRSKLLTHGLAVRRVTKHGFALVEASG